MNGRLLWVTDPHLNFVGPDRARAFGLELRKLDVKAPLVVTGDISEAPALVRDLTALAGGYGRPTFFVLGNHDYYRSSWRAVRRQMRVTRLDPLLTYLDSTGPIPLGGDLALVGQTGWYDGLHGNTRTTPVMLTDFVRIAELSGCRSRGALLQTIQSRATFEADNIAAKLAHAVELGYERVIVATHVPPFPGATFHERGPSNADWLPWFTSGLMGAALERALDEHPNLRMLVLTGHTHGAGVYQHSDRMRVVSGAAQYGSPALAGIVDLAAFDVTAAAGSDGDLPQPDAPLAAGVAEATG